jgi:hypothetical protein
MKETSDETQGQAGVTEIGSPPPAAEAGASSDGDAAADAGSESSDDHPGDGGQEQPGDNTAGDPAASNEQTEGPQGSPEEGQAQNPDAKEGAVVDAELDETELEDLNRQLDASRDDRNPGALPRGVVASDPLESMAALPSLGDPAYSRWLEGLVEVYRAHCKELRATARRVGAAMPDLPDYPAFKP